MTTSIVSLCTNVILQVHANMCCMRKLKMETQKYNNNHKHIVQYCIGIWCLHFTLSNTVSHSSQVANCLPNDFQMRSNVCCMT
jgi:hypothetical protein